MKKKKKGCLVMGMAFLFIVILALTVAMWPSQKLTLDPDKIGLKWEDTKTLFTESFAKNETDEDWTGMVSIQIDNLEGETLWNRTAESWLNKKVKSGKGAWVSTMIPFSDIKGRYTEDTIIIRYKWGIQEVKMQFEL